MLCNLIQTIFSFPLYLTCERLGQLTGACKGVTVAMMSGLSGALALLELGPAARHSQHTHVHGSKDTAGRCEMLSSKHVHV